MTEQIASSRVLVIGTDIESPNDQVLSQQQADAAQEPRVSRIQAQRLVAMASTWSSRRLGLGRLAKATEHHLQNLNGSENDVDEVLRESRSVLVGDLLEPLPL